MSLQDSLGNTCHHKVSLQMVSIASPAISEFTTLQNAQRVYGRYGILLEFVGGQSIGLTAAQQSVLEVIDGDCGWQLTSYDQRMLHNISTMPLTDDNIIRVYFVNRILETTGRTLNGCGGYNPGRPGVDVAVIGTRWTFAHELGHVLLGSRFVPVHADSDRGNLMHAPTGEITSDPPALTIDQVRAIISSRYCVPC